MPVIDYLNQRLFTDHPFVGPVTSFGTAGSSSSGEGDDLEIDRRWIVDAGLTYGPASGVPATGDVAWLDEITSDGSTAEFHFTNVTGLWFKFEVDLAATFGTTYFAEASLTQNGSVDPALGFGFLQVGDLASLAEAGAGSWTGSAVLEECTVQNLARHQVATLNVANQPATTYDDGCQSSSAAPSGDYIVEASGLTGDLFLAPGRFITLSATSGRNQIAVSLTRVEAMGGSPPCDDPSVYPEGYDPANEPQCNEAVHSLNGIAANPETGGFFFSGSRGITVEAGGDHEIVITINQQYLFGNQPEPENCE